MMNDQLIIDNTHFREEEGKLICYTNLPDGDTFSQQVSAREAVQKNMIGWCNTVREYMNAKEAQREEEVIAAKARRRASATSATSAGETVSVPTTPMNTDGQSDDPKAAVLAWYEVTQARIDSLGEAIEEMKAERKALRDERDKIMPIIKAWKGVKGEESD